MTRKLIASTLLLIMFVACTTPGIELQTPFQTPTDSFDINDGGLISGQPCESPCFFGVRIGETRLEQVIPLLEGHGIHPCYPYGESTIICGIDFISVTVGANASTLIVNGISFSPSVPITMGDLIEKYGVPSLVQVFPGGTPEAPNISADFLWDSIKMRVDLPEIEEENYVIEKTTEIQEIIFLDDVSYSELTASGFSQPWNGFGKYQP